MKKLMALGLAAGVALGALGTAGTADARPMFWPHQHYQQAPFWQYHTHPGFFFGFNFGPSYPIYPGYYYANKHVQWCAARYRTYNPATDTFHPTRTSTAVCVSPWWTYH